MFFLHFWDQMKAVRLPDSAIVANQWIVQGACQLADGHDTVAWDNFQTIGD